MPTSIFTPGSVVPQGADDCVVYSNSPDLDGFGTDETPPGWPALSCKITAVEVELTVTSQFTANGQVQVVVTPPNALAPLPGAVSDASGTWSGWDGGTGQYRSSTADAYYLNKFGGWLTDYISFASSIATSARIESTSAVTPVPGFDIRFRGRQADVAKGTRSVAIAAADTLSLGQMFGIGLYPVVSGGGVYVRFTGGVGVRVAPWTSVTPPVNNQWASWRATHDGTTLRVYQDPTGDPNLNTWTLAWSQAVTASQTVPSLINFGATNTLQGFDGDLSHIQIRDGAGTMVHEFSLDAMDASADTGWSSPYNSVSRDASGNTCTGATIPATKRVRVDLDTPCPLADFRLIVDAQTGALTVDEILLEAECEPPVTRRRRRGLGLIRG